MFAIAVTPGSERRMTTSYSSGFVPTYVPAPTEETQGKKIKRLIVPGYVFVLEKMRGAERVLDAEWKIIEALATPGINTIDQNARVVSGPLVGLDEVVARVEGNRASIHASILGKWRWYEIEVLRTVTEPADTTTEGKIDTRADDSGDASVVESKKMDQEDTKMAEKKTYTEEELNAAIEKAKEVGIHAAAKESGIPWQTIMGAARKAGVEIEPKKTNKKQEEKKKAKAAKPKKVESKKAPAKKSKKAELKAEAAEVVEEPAPEEKKPKAKKAEPEPTTDRPDNELAIENAVLKAENAKLKEKIEKLQKALHDLM